MTLEMPDLPELRNNLNDQLPDGTPVKRFYSFQELCLEVLSMRYVDADHFAWFCHTYPDAASEAVEEITEMLELQIRQDVLEKHLTTRYNLVAYPNAEGKPLREWLTDTRAQLIRDLSVNRDDA